MAKFFPILSISILALAIAGCGGSPKPEGLPDLVPCTVTVTMGGAPLEDASVSLVAPDGRWPGNGRTDSKGKAVIMTRGQYAGVAPGDYKVTVTKTLPPPATGRDEGSDAEPESLVASKFTSLQTTPLTCNVAPGSADFTFEVDAP